MHIIQEITHRNQESEHIQGRLSYSEQRGRRPNICQTGASGTY